ncbi:MAG: hypothetical protein ACO31E_03025 [Phycisphaerales bacterium]
MCAATLRRTSQTAGRLAGCADQTAESPADEGADEGANGGTDAAARHAEAHAVAAERGTTEAVDALARISEAGTESPGSARDSVAPDEYADTRTIAHRSQAECNAACARSFTDLDSNEATVGATVGATDETTDAGHGERFDEAFEQADADESPADDAAESEARSRASAVAARSVPTGAHSHGTLSSHYDATLA